MRDSTAWILRLLVNGATGEIVPYLTSAPQQTNVVSQTGTDSSASAPGSGDRSIPAGTPGSQGAKEAPERRVGRGRSSAGRQRIAGPGTIGAQGLQGTVVLGPQGSVGAGPAWQARADHPQGTVGAQGLIGAQGARAGGFVRDTGNAGLTVLSGAGPAAGLGLDGDFYIDTANNVIYGPKTAGAWVRRRL